MRRGTPSRAPLCIPAALALAVVAFVGCRSAPEAIVLRQKTTIGGPQGRSDDSTQYWTDKMMVVEQGGTRLIVDFIGQTLTSIDQNSKTFVRRTFDETKAQIEADTERKLQEAAEYPADARAELERLGQLPTEKTYEVEVTPTGKFDTIAGYQAEEHTFTGTAASGTLWVSEALTLPLGPKEREAFVKSTSGMNTVSMQFALAMLKTNRIPLRTDMTATLNPTGSSAHNEVLEVRREDLPPGLTEIPKDYKQITPGARPPGH